MSTVEERGQDIFNYLLSRKNQKIRRHQVLAACGLQDGAKTQAAARHAVQLAVNAGLHFPPAVPQNGFTWTVTDLPSRALDPALQMSRIAAGAQARAEVGHEYMRKHERQMEPGDRAMFKAIDAYNQAAAQVLQARDQLALDLVKIRRESRSTT